MNLYEITEELRAVYEAIEENGGEITDELNEQLQLTTGQLQDKAEGYCNLIRNVSADADAYKAEIDRLTARKKAADNLVKRLKEALKNAMVLSDQQKIKAGLFSLSLRSTDAVEVTDEQSIPEEYFQVKREVMKSAIKDAIKNGEEVAGARIVSNTSLTIR